MQTGQQCHELVRDLARTYRGAPVRLYPDGGAKVVGTLVSADVEPNYHTGGLDLFVEITRGDGTRSEHVFRAENLSFAGGVLRAGDRDVLSFRQQRRPFRKAA